MTRPDQPPGQPSPILRRFVRAMKWLALLSVVVAAIAVLLVAQGAEGVHLHMLIATALGVALTVLLGTGLMVLTFLSSSSGHDEEASKFDKDEE